MGSVLRRGSAALSITLLALVCVLLAAAAAFSPVPTSWLVRQAFEQGAAKASKALEPLLPAGIETQVERYTTTPAVPGLAVHRGPGTGLRPAVIWVHGGGWLSGSKEEVANYLKIVASHGVVTAAMDYSLAPAHAYPTQIRQINDALAHLHAHAERLGIDRERLFLAGDSAGAQIAAQMAAIVTDPAYAQRVGVQPAIAARQLRGVLLFCGPYELSWLMRGEGFAGHVVRSGLWGFLGGRDIERQRGFDEASVLRHVTAAFPAAFITVGSADPLAPHSTALADRLTALGVPVDTLFYAPGHEPALGHEYQFGLDGADARHALQRALAFVKARS
jgi:acetyl esterase